MRRLLLTLMIGLVAGSCASKSPSFRSPTGNRETSSLDVTIELLAADEQGPQGELRFNDLTQQPNIGSNCWSWIQEGGIDTTRCADTTSEVLVPDGHMTVPTGTVLRIVGDVATVSGVLGRVVDDGHGGFELERVAALEFVDGRAVLDALLEERRNGR